VRVESNRDSKAARSAASTAARSRGRLRRRAIEVAVMPGRPQGTMASKRERSGSTLRARPCIETPAWMRTPTAPSLAQG
jgi:hypothetical protein